MDNMEGVFTVCPENDEHQISEVKSDKLHLFLRLLSVSLSNCLSAVISQDSEGMDLDMFAPYISMDDDFQLTSFSWLPEPADRPLPSSPEPAGLTPVGTVSRKRYNGLFY